MDRCQNIAALPAGGWVGGGGEEMISCKLDSKIVFRRGELHREPRPLEGPCFLRAVVRTSGSGCVSTDMNLQLAWCLWTLILSQTLRALTEKYPHAFGILEIQTVFYSIQF